MRSSSSRTRTALAAALLSCAASIAMAQIKPPAAPVKPVADTYFGKPVADPYRYLEDVKDPEVAAWMQAQADYTRAMLDAIPQRKVLLAEVTRYGDAASARVTSLQMVAGHAYYLKRNADENIPKLYVRDGFRGKERLLVDPDRYAAPEGKHNAIDYFQPSPDNRYVAYGISVGGSEESVLRVLDLNTGKETGEVIDRANFATPSFLPDGRLLYSRMQSLRPALPSPTSIKIRGRTFTRWEATRTRTRPCSAQAFSGDFDRCRGACVCRASNRVELRRRCRGQRYPERVQALCRASCRFER